MEYWEKHRKEISNLSLPDLEILIDKCKSAYRVKYNDTYVEVNIHNYYGNISDRIEKETGYPTRHVKADNSSMGIGRNIVSIHKEQYTRTIEWDLKEKYDSWKNQ